MFSAVVSMADNVIASINCLQMNAERVARYIAGWMADYLCDAGARGFVVGVSGGIDSAVVSSLAALSGCRTLCVTLPIHQAASQVDRAAEHVSRLAERYANVETADADLTDAYEAFRAALTPSFREPLPQATVDMAGANARSRLRMTALYYYAGMYNMLVAGTGNKIEDFGVGFFTKYGDGGVDISPIADLTKTEVYALGDWLGVPASIMEAPPTDGLFGDDRTDEQQIGATYAELEQAMHWFETGVEPALSDVRGREVYDIFVRRNRANRHKMEPVPVCRIPDIVR